MEVKIGVQHTSREITLESEDSPESVEKAVSQSLSSGSPLRLVDRKGTVVLVPAGTAGPLEDPVDRSL